MLCAEQDVLVVASVALWFWTCQSVDGLTLCQSGMRIQYWLLYDVSIMVEADV